MDIKNTAILLIFLLAILGLIIGVHYTETSESSKLVTKYEKTVHEDQNGVQTISLDKILKEEKTLSNLFT